MDRRAIAVSGIVQGVGFRPYVFGLASELCLNGFVKNNAGQVLIEVEGEAPSLDRFLRELTENAPPLAQIDDVRWSDTPPRGEGSFRIDPSESESTDTVFIAPDVATCDDCLRELFDPADRRYRYPFLNCTNCGPRLTIITSAPYDRARTTMASFAMCAACRAEYEDPANRRFHAQPVACPACGPVLQVLDGHGATLPDVDPVAWTAAALRAGKIAAIKGLGGYHLACVATNVEAVNALRRRKHRDEKPFAVMVADVSAAHALCEISKPEQQLLESPRRPIVLLRRRHGNCVLEGVAPNSPQLGVMLPYTPLHHLLLQELDGTPLVMTSGNQSDEPIVYEDQDILGRLSTIADFFLVHDRRVHLRCDDSVTRVVGGAELPIRRARGYAPEPLSLPFACDVPTLAVGGQLKSTFALGREWHAFLSHHLGDLDDYQAFRAFTQSVTHYEGLFGIQAERIVHDLHPDYAATRFAREVAAGRPLLAVQHHHAHMASCMAENCLQGPVIGVTFDGTGLGTDETIWGGELLVGDYHGFQRAAHLRPVVMPGGERAIREPWRMAAVYLLDAGLGTSLLTNNVAPSALATVERMVETRLNTPVTTSAGRLFDAVASLVGLRQVVSFEGQAAMELEALATEANPEGIIYPFDIAESETPGGPQMLDTRPIIASVAADLRGGVEVATIAGRFHSTVAAMIVAACQGARRKYGLEDVVLSGGVFLNSILTTEVTERLTGSGFRVFRHRRVPPNDGGLSLGQLAIAAAQGSTQGVANVFGYPRQGG